MNKKDTNINEEQKSNKKERHTYIDVLRILGIFAVVTIHVAGSWWYTEEKGSPDWNKINFFHSFFRYSIPLLLMVSGAIFLNYNKNITLKRIYTKNIFKMALVLLFWGTIYTINLILNGELLDQRGRELNTILDYIILVSYGEYHLWYLYTIIGLYMIVPILREITKNKKMLEYMIILGMAIYLINFLKTFPVLSKYLDYPAAELNIHFVMGYTTLFLIGHYIHTYNIKKKFRMPIYILGIISLLSIVWLSYMAGTNKDISSIAYYSPKLPMQAIGSAAIFLFFKNWNYLKVSKYKGIIQYISSRSFGVYLVHVLVLYYLLRLNTEDFVKSNYLIGILAVSIAVFIISFIISDILKRIPIIKKYCL